MTAALAATAAAGGGGEAAAAGTAADDGAVAAAEQAVATVTERLRRLRQHEAAAAAGAAAGATEGEAGGAAEASEKLAARVAALEAAVEARRGRAEAATAAASAAAAAAAEAEAAVEAALEAHATDHLALLSAAQRRRAAAAEERQHAVAAAAEAEAAAEAAEGALAERRRALRAEADVTAAMEADSADAAAAGPHRTAHTFRAAQKAPPVRDPSDALDAALSAAMHAASLPLRVGVRRLDERGACVFETMPGAGRAAGTPLRVQLALGPKGLLSARAAGGGAAVALSELWMAMCDEAPPAADGDDDERVGASVGRIAQLAERERVAAGAARRGAGRCDAAEQRWEQQHVGGGGRLRAERQLRVVLEPPLEAQPRRAAGEGAEGSAGEDARGTGR